MIKSFKNKHKFKIDRLPAQYHNVFRTDPNRLEIVFRKVHK